MALRCFTVGDAVQRATNIVPGSSDYTCVFWWRFTGAQAIRTLFASVQDVGVGNNIVEINETGSSDIGSYLGVAGVFTDINPLFGGADDVWTSVAYVRQGTAHRTYFNRNLVGSATVNFAAVTPVLMGLGDIGWLNASEHEFVYFREWDAALTIVEIQNEINSTTVVRTADLVADTPLINDRFDISGNGNHWTLVGTPDFIEAELPSRLYPTPKATIVPFYGPAKGTWAVKGAERPYSPILDSWLMSSSKSNGGTMTNWPLETNQQANYDYYFKRFVFGPLAAQSVGGTFDCCFAELCRWKDEFDVRTNASLCRTKIHMYISQGATSEVRGVLLNNFIESVDWPFPTETWKQLSSVQNLASVSVTSGDYLVIELGPRITTSPTPTPHYPPDEFSEMFFTGSGTNALPASANTSYQDAVNGETTLLRAPWFQFSHAFVLIANPDPNENDSCADAIEITTFPYTSPTLVTTQSTGGASIDRDAWFTFIAPNTGKVCLDTRGSNYFTDVDVYNGDDCGSLTPVLWLGNQSQAANRSQTYAMFDATQGERYWINITNFTALSNARASGGTLILNVYYRELLPAIDDIYFPNGIMGQWRDGRLVNWSTLFYSTPFTGIGIDYTKRPMDDSNGGINVNERILAGLFPFDIVEIINVNDLSFGQIGQDEVDFIADPWDVLNINQHPAQLNVNSAGLLRSAWFGDGFQYVAGVGSLPSQLNNISSDPIYSAFKIIDATSGDNQPGAPFADVVNIPTVQLAAPWAISIDHSTDTLYYTSAGFYIPLGGGAAQEIRRWNLTAQTQMTAFAVVPLQAGNNPGIKGVLFAAGIGVFVANSTVLQLYAMNGTLIRTYTPSLPLESQSLCGIRLIRARTRVWVHDEVTGRFFQFDVATGVQTDTFETLGIPGTSVDFEIYNSGAPPASGIYFIDPGKTNDTLYVSVDPEETTVVKIPDPTFRLGPIGK